MIIVRAPLRITLGGGGTDIPAYYKRHGGYCIAAAINKYVYITVHDTFVDDLIVKYSSLERVPSASLIKHPIIREVMLSMQLSGRRLEICSMADIPAGTGLGSSSSFTVALIKALRLHGRVNDASYPHELAEAACDIEITTLNSPIGKQDQYIAAYGGIQEMTFDTHGRVSINAIPIDRDFMWDLEENLALFFTGYHRSTNAVLDNTDIKHQVQTLGVLKHVARETFKALCGGDADYFAELLNIQWDLKKERLDKASNSDIDRWYKLGINNGASGGKLVGAGGGGFLLFYAKDKRTLRQAMKSEGLPEVNFKFDHSGAMMVSHS